MRAYRLGLREQQLPPFMPFSCDVNLLSFAEYSDG